MLSIAAIKPIIKECETCISACRSLSAFLFDFEPPLMTQCWPVVCELAAVS